ncbi:hypothetical protein PR048_028809 [Dryococelus australis]|uniref:Uncharacterized protein n=1 Tax=Dryococelus australis TaxID=614101 RepID=A0ABQ9GE51_9NEOP|nr:hypothetical protein PR048_028809 [Dryococelus australis]
MATYFVPTVEKNMTRQGALCRYCQVLRRQYESVYEERNLAADEPQRRVNCYARPVSPRATTNRHSLQADGRQEVAWTGVTAPITPSTDQSERVDELRASARLSAHHLPRRNYGLFYSGLVKLSLHEAEEYPASKILAGLQKRLNATVYESARDAPEHSAQERLAFGLEHGETEFNRQVIYDIRGGELFCPDRDSSPTGILSAASRFAAPARTDQRPGFPRIHQRNQTPSGPHTANYPLFCSNLSIVQDIEVPLLDTQAFGSRQGRSRIFACGNCAGRCRSSADFLGDLPFPPPFHSSATPYSPRFTLFGSRPGHGHDVDDAASRLDQEEAADNFLHCRRIDFHPVDRKRCVWRTLNVTNSKYCATFLRAELNFVSRYTLSVHRHTLQIGLQAACKLSSLTSCEILTRSRTFDNKAPLDIWFNLVLPPPSRATHSCLQRFLVSSAPVFVQVRYANKSRMDYKLQLHLSVKRPSQKYGKIYRHSVPGGGPARFYARKAGDISQADNPFLEQSRTATSCGYNSSHPVWHALYECLQDIHGDSLPFLLQPFHELSPHPAIQFVLNMSYRVEVGPLCGRIQSANIVFGNVTIVFMLPRTNTSGPTPKALKHKSTDVLNYISSRVPNIFCPVTKLPMAESEVKVQRARLFRVHFNEDKDELRPYTIRNHAEHTEQTAPTVNLLTASALSTLSLSKFSSRSHIFRTHNADITHNSEIEVQADQKLVTTRDVVFRLSISCTSDFCVEHSPAGSPNFRKWESCRTMPLVGGFSQGSPVSSAPSFRRCSIFTSITLIGSQDLAVKSRPNLFSGDHGGVPGFSQVGIVPDDVGFLGDIPFPPHLHSGAAPYSPQSPSSALETSMLRACTGCFKRAHEPQNRERGTTPAHHNAWRLYDCSINIAVPPAEGAVSAAHVSRYLYPCLGDTPATSAYRCKAPSTIITRNYFPAVVNFTGSVSERVKIYADRVSEDICPAVNNEKKNKTGADQIRVASSISNLRAGWTPAFKVQKRGSYTGDTNTHA